MALLFDPLQLSDRVLPNRIVLAPMPRSREHANAFSRTAGLRTDEPVEAWRPVVASIHQTGRQTVAQLWHGGRAGAQGLLAGAQPRSSSSVNDDLPELQVWGLLVNGAYASPATV